MAKIKSIKRQPSRARYEEENPTVSFRLPRDIRDRLVAQIKALGQSPADWVKDHLDQDDARAEARAEILAKKRDDLGQSLESLERLVEQRQRELDVPIGEEKKRRRRELDDWYKRERKNLESRLSFGLIAVERAQVQMEQERASFEDEAVRLRALRLEVAALRREKAALEQQMKQWRREMEAGTRLINQWPWLLGNQCPESVWRRMVSNLAQKTVQN